MNLKTKKKSNIGIICVKDSSNKESKYVENCILSNINI